MSQCGDQINETSESTDTPKPGKNELQNNNIITEQCGDQQRQVIRDTTTKNQAELENEKVYEEIQNNELQNSTTEEQRDKTTTDIKMIPKNHTVDENETANNEDIHNIQHTNRPECDNTKNIDDLPDKFVDKNKLEQTTNDSIPDVGDVRMKSPPRSEVLTLPSNNKMQQCSEDDDVSSDAKNDYVCPDKIMKSDAPRFTETSTGVKFPEQVSKIIKRVEDIYRELEEIHLDVSLKNKLIIIKSPGIFTL